MKDLEKESRSARPATLWKVRDLLYSSKTNLSLFLMLPIFEVVRLENQMTPTSLTTVVFIATLYGRTVKIENDPDLIPKLLMEK